MDVHFYASESEKGLNGRPSIVPQGNVLGGGSSINAMVYIRGQKQDYDTWAQMGCRHWSYDKVLPVFRALEGNQRLSDEFHGADGPLKVSDRRYGHPISWAFIRPPRKRAALHRRLQRRSTRKALASTRPPRTRDAAESSAWSFLRDAEGRPNLTILTEASVCTKSFSKARRATGIALESGETYSAGREVILYGRRALLRRRSCSSPASAMPLTSGGTVSTWWRICRELERTTRIISRQRFRPRSASSRCSGRTGA